MKLSLRNSCNACLSILLTLAMLSSMATAARAQNNPADDPDQKELLAYTLTMDKIHRLADATKQMKEWEQKNPEESKGMQDGELKNATSISEQAKLFEAKFPPAVAILKKNGYTAKEYLVALYAFIQSAMIVGMKKAGQLPDASKVDGIVNPANIELVEKNWDEIEKLNASMNNPETKE